MMVVSMEASKQGRRTARGCRVDVAAIMAEVAKAPIARRVAMFSALADPTRLQMVHLLSRTGELCVCDFTAVFALGQPTISHHLRILREAGIVTCRKRGQWVHCSLERTVLKGLVGTLLDCV